MTEQDLLQKMKNLEDIVETDTKHIAELFKDIEQLDNLLSPNAQDILDKLRPQSVTNNVYENLENAATWSNKLEDRMAATAGSWRFIVFFVVFMSIWIMFNVLLQSNAFDPYPFILLNLRLSTLAALQAPVILMSQNRQEEKDRAVAYNDYQVNLKTELEIADLHRKVDELSTLIVAQEQILQSIWERLKSFPDQ